MENKSKRKTGQKGKSIGADSILIALYVLPLTCDQAFFYKEGGHDRKLLSLIR